MKLGILGPGTLGLSLARHAAERGLEVRLLGRDREHASRGLAQLEDRWQRAAEKGRMDSQELVAVRGRISAHAPGGEALCGLDALLEAIPEDPDLKALAWRELAPRLEGNTLRLTATSSLPVGALDQKAALDGRLMGFHLFVPVGRMGVVELVTLDQTPRPDLLKARDLALRLALRVVPVKDQAGFAAARMALAQGLEAMRLLEAGTATAEDLDALMVLGYGHPVGPLELSDRVGLDLRLRIAESLHRATGDGRFEPPALLRDMVARGELGRKTGIGFYTWNRDGRRR